MTRREKRLARLKKSQMFKNIWEKIKNVFRGPSPPVMPAEIKPTPKKNELQDQSLKSLQYAQQITYQLEDGRRVPIDTCRWNLNEKFHTYHGKDDPCIVLNQRVFPIQGILDGSARITSPVGTPKAEAPIYGMSHPNCLCYLVCYPSQDPSWEQNGHYVKIDALTLVAYPGQRQQIQEYQPQPIPEQRLTPMEEEETGEEAEKAPTAE